MSDTGHNAGWFVLLGVTLCASTGCGSNDTANAGANGATGGATSAGGSTVGGGTGGSIVASGGATSGAGTGGVGVTGNGGVGATGTGGSGTSGNGGTGATGAGGTSQTAGGRTGAGGSGQPGCPATTQTACTSPTVSITEIDVGAPTVVNEDDAALKMLSLSPIPSGGSRVAWMSTDGNVHVTSLDCADHVTGSFSLPAVDYGDIFADDAGGVLLLTRAAQGGGTLNCGAPTNLCGTPPSPPVPCNDMYLVRFDGSSEKWATKLSTSSAALPPYSTGPTGPDVYFTWWYAHHGRLAFDGTNWAAYYGAAVSTSQKCTTGGNTAINIHQGDEMRVVSPTGALVPGHGSFDWGCSHSGFEKIVWDPGASEFVMICRSDAYPQPGLNVNASRSIFSIDPGNSSVSNVVLAQAAGSYWTLVSNAGALHLFRFTTAGGTAADISLGAGDEPHLVKYGAHLLAAWSSGGSMVGQVLDAATGDKIGTSLAISVTNNMFQDFRDYPDGSAAYAAPGSSPTKLQIARVMACSG